MKNYLIHNEKKRIPLDIEEDLLIYGLNGTGKTRILNLINKYHVKGISEVDETKDIQFSGVNYKGKVKKKKTVKEIFYIIEGLQSIEEQINENFTSIISNEEMRMFMRVKKHIRDISVHGGNVNLISPKWFDEMFELLNSKGILGDLSREYITDGMVTYLYNEFRYNRFKIEKRNRDKYKGDKTVELLETNKSVKKIDNIIERLKNHFSMTVDFNSVKRNNKITEKLTSTIFFELSEIEKRKNNLNNEFKKYFFNEIEFDIDFNTWKWFIKMNRRKIEFEYLSSGEKNIIIILLTVCFSERELIIIDEPEISFSENYTRSFIESIYRLKNNSTNIILATHSYYIYTSFPGEKIELRPN